MKTRKQLEKEALKAATDYLFPEHADFFVKAVNSHDKLVAALREIAETTSQTDYAPETLNEVVKIAQIALRDAEKGEK